ncbi:uncharacterized protein LOC111630558 [Centruroides sculpturatus]|uniref:uncharacterized protein LOC111630558 n=1 Tax=Centruroides sculpturatus TaxID=218467 RepID=UPI000C6D9C57|nr:uncharacterized protein LOC111630558 [Centruroides sculpturatus]
MGSPVSGDLCEMVVRQLKNNILPRFIPNMLLYKCHIDDIIILWKSEPNLKQFVDTVNNNQYSLVIEIEQHSYTNVHFLDIDISFEGQKIHTAVYRKTSNTSTYIPMGSCNLFQYKLAAFRALIKRAFTHSSSPQALSQEMRHIQEIAVAHGYTNIVQGLYKRYRSSQEADNRTQRQIQIEEENIERIPITFNPQLKSMYNEIARKHQVYITYRRCQTIFQLLRNGKDPPNLVKLPGIYTIPLTDHRFDREVINISSTRQSLGIRIKEHKADVQHNRTTTALSTYATDTNITLDFEAAHIIITTTHPEHLK